MTGAHWGAGLVGPDGTDYVTEQADIIRRKMGRGLYSQDPHGAMGQWRDLIAIPLALLRNLRDWMVANGNPGTAEDTLETWEQILGIAFWADRLTIAQRQQRCKERMRRWVGLTGDPPGMPDGAGFPTEWNLWRIFYTIHYRALGVGPTSFVVTVGEPRYTLTVHADMLLPGNAYWYNELTRMRDMLCPAWGEIIITT